KAPTLGEWELDLLRTIEHVVRLGHVEQVSSDEIVLDRGSMPLEPDALVLHCAASGLLCPPLVPLWGDGRIRLPPIPLGLPVLNRGPRRLRGGHARRRR